MNYLIVGLGNQGELYSKNRHNLGFMVLDYIAKQESIQFENGKYGVVAHSVMGGRDVFFLKPSTYMNSSGLAATFWMKKLFIKKENLLVIYDDLDLSLTKIKIKESGTSGGHNGIKSIEEYLQTQKFARMKLGIERNYEKGQQVKYVLSDFSEEEFKAIEEKMKIVSEAVKVFVKEGLLKAMNMYNGK